MRWWRRSGCGVSCCFYRPNVPSEAIFIHHRGHRGSQGYLLFHHTPTPAIRTIAGSRNWLVALTKLNCERVIVMRRSSRSLGRIEIKSSSEESQLMVFKARSLLPLKFRKPLASQEELPTTTNRP